MVDTNDILDYVQFTEKARSVTKYDDAITIVEECKKLIKIQKQNIILMINIIVFH